jgi:hemoglobin
MHMKKLLIIVAMTIASLTSSIAMADDSLYQSFGQKAGLTALMEDFVPRLLKDPRMEPFFAKANQQNLKEQLTNQICQVTGGPCIYKGVDMKTVHRELDITKGNFNALVEVLQDSMDAQKIPFRAQNKLLALLAPMHRDVITVK